MCEALGLCCPCQTRLILLLQVGSTCRIKSASCIFLKIGYLCQSLDRYIATVIVLLRFSTIGHLQYMSVLIYSMKPKSYSSVNERRKTSTSVWQDYRGRWGGGGGGGGSSSERPWIFSDKKGDNVFFSSEAKILQPSPLISQTICFERICACENTGAETAYKNCL